MSEPVPANEHCGIPDAFQRLWTPHRMAYIRGEAKPATEEASQCPFCQAPELDDAEGLIVVRGTYAYVVMNLFPYSPGHLLVCPYRHVSGYVDATAAETREIAELTQQAIATLSSVSHPDGFNIGMNQGAVAGAGIAAHLHQHVVPRWAGDMNFMPIIGQTRVLPQLLGDARSQLATAWQTMA